MKPVAAQQPTASLTNRVYIGLGSNLEEPSQQLASALVTISAIPHCNLVKYSSFYQSDPMGPQDQNPFINAVAQLTTSLSAIALLDELQKIEHHQGRVRKAERWGPRTLDLDILLYNNEVIESPRLVVPHYGMKQRNFVLIPLHEIAPNIVLPDATPLSQLILKIDRKGISQL